jgi:hypothetical protein
MEQLKRNANVFKVTTYSATKEVTKANSTCDCGSSIAPSVPGTRKDVTFAAGVGQREAHVSSRHFWGPILAVRH